MDFQELVARTSTLLEARDIPDETAIQVRNSDQFAVYLVWNSDDPLMPGRSYQFLHPNGQSVCSISALKHRLDPQSDNQLAADTLNINEIGYCNIELETAVDFAPFHIDQELGRFSLEDKLTGREVATGLIKHGLRRATNIRWQELQIDQQARARAMRQKPHVLWFTGLSGSGKSTIAGLVEKKLHAMGLHTYVLDGDNVRHGLCRDLGFTDADRVENIRRVSETARLLADAGLIVIVSFISPFIAERRMARSLFKKDEFLEVFVDTPLKVCEQRDPKGLYKKARAGKIKNFTGLDSPYERPESAEIVLTSTKEPAEELANRVLKYQKQTGLIVTGEQ